MTNKLSSSRIARQRGFTLAEMLVVLGLLGLISALTVSGLRIAGALRTHSDQRSTAAENLFTVDSILRRLLAVAYPRIDGDGIASGQVFFRGSAERIEFAAPFFRYTSTGGLHRITVSGDEGRLVLRWRPVQSYTSEAQSQPTWEQATLLANVAEARFTYFGRIDGDEASMWHTVWNEQTTLPRIVRVDLWHRFGRELENASLVIALRIDVDAACILDRLNHRCRGR